MKQRNNTVDAIKGLCIIFVLLLHCNLKGDVNDVLSAFIYQSAVPVFLFISSYLLYASIDRSKNIKKWYFKKIIQYLIPYIIFYLLNIIIQIFIYKEKLNIKKEIFYFILGGNGPGGYYIPVLIQLIVLSPVMVKVIKKMKQNSVLLFFIINVLYEALKLIIALDSRIYRLLIFRYLFVIGYGLYASSSFYKYSKKLSFVFISVGFIFISLYLFFDNCLVIFDQWTSTCVLSTMFWIPITVSIIEKKSVNNRLVIFLGQNTYGIYLFQMLYFGYLYKNLYDLGNNYVYVVVNILICLIFGLLFSNLSKKITMIIVRKIEYIK